MEVAQAIHTKRAVREFTTDRLPDSELQAILDAGRRAPSAKNMQPWHFLAVRERESLQALAQSGTYAAQLAEAAAAIAILTPDPAQRWSILFDAGQAAAYMQLAAWDLGVGSCPVTIYEQEKARQVLGFPPDFHLHVVLSLGYPADPAAISRPPRAGGRKPRQEIMSFDRWGQAPAAS